MLRNLAVGLRLAVVAILAGIGLLFLLVTFSPFVSWYATTLARPWDDYHGDILVVLSGPAPNIGTGNVPMMDPGTYWRCFMAVLYDREDVLLDKYFSNILGVVVTNYPRHYLPSPHSLADAIVNGLGYGLLPEVQAQAHFDSNALIDLTPDAFLDVPLYWHHWSGEAASAGSISDIVIDEARKRLLA